MALKLIISLQAILSMENLGKEALKEILQDAASWNNLYYFPHLNALRYNMYS
jgi:hypothetical protein